MNTQHKKSPARNALIILVVTLILAAVFHLELVDLAARYLPDSRARSVAETDAPQPPAVGQPAAQDASARGLSAGDLPQPETDCWLTAEHGASPAATVASTGQPDDDSTLASPLSAKSDLPDAGPSVQVEDSPEKGPPAVGNEPQPATARPAQSTAAAPVERQVSSDATTGPQALSTGQPEESPAVAGRRSSEPSHLSSQRRRESEATAAVRVALALQDAGEVAEASERLRSVVDDYPGTSAARLAERLLQAADTGGDRQTSDILQRAAEEQAAGRWAQARHFLELAATRYRGTAAADEAAQRLKVVAEEQWKQREEEAAGFLRQALALDEQGQSGRAQRSCEWIATNYRGTAAATEAAERLTALATDAQGQRDQIAADTLRKAIALQESGELAEAQRLLEWIVATYGGQTIADEAAERLSGLLQGERQQRGETAERMLREAVALQADGKLIEARQLLFQILSLYRHTPQHDEALRRQQQVEQALAQQEAEQDLRRAAEMQQEGRPDQARWMLEQIVRKYRHTPAAQEAAARLERLARQGP